MKIATYLRVSTLDQTCENQRLQLAEYCRSRGWTEVREFADTGESGAKARRPALDALMKAVRAGQVQAVVVAAFDRFGRSVRHLVLALEELQHLGVQFISLREQIDTGSPIGKAVFTIIAAIAELERALIVERVKAGLRRAAREGKHVGRPTVGLDLLKVRALQREGVSLRQIGERLGVSARTVRRSLA